MGRIIVFRDIIKDLEKRPRNITLFGQEDMVVDQGKSYDLYYFHMNGVRYTPSLSSQYSVIPVFLDPGSLEGVAKKFSSHNKKYNNTIAGICGDNKVFALFNLYRDEEGFTFDPITDAGEISKVDLLEHFELEDQKGLKRDIEKAIQDIKNQAAIFSRSG